MVAGLITEGGGGGADADHMKRIWNYASVLFTVIISVQWRNRDISHGKIGDKIIKIFISSIRSASENPGGFLFSRRIHGGFNNPEHNPPSNRRIII